MNHGTHGNHGKNNHRIKPILYEHKNTRMTPFGVRRKTQISGNLFNLCHLCEGTKRVVLCGDVA